MVVLPSFAICTWFILLFFPSDIPILSASKYYTIHKGAVCRLMDRISESVYFFFIGISVWCFATKDVALRMWETFTNDHDLESGWSPACDPNCDVHYHTEAVVQQMVLLVGAALYPLHFVLLNRLRQFVDQWTGVADDELQQPHYERLPTTKTRKKDWAMDDSSTSAGSDSDDGTFLLNSDVA
jgi:hypothetical protein